MSARCYLLLIFMFEVQNATGGNDHIDLTSKLYDLQMSASSYAEGYPPKFGRITTTGGTFGSFCDHSITSLKDTDQVETVQMVKGWCARQDDGIPYLQIDFVVRVQVNIVKVFEWYEVRWKDRIFVPKDAGDIVIIHGNSTEAELLENITGLDGTNYTDIKPEDKEFGVPYGSRVRTFYVNVSSRYLRIQAARSASSEACMILQVLGHGHLAYIDSGPVTNISSIGIFEVDTVTFSENTVNHLGKLNNSEDCKSLCNINLSCQVAVYNDVVGTCNAYDYISSEIPRLSHRSNYTTQFQKLYVRDKFLQDEIVTSKFRLISFPRFPLFYSLPDSINWFIDYSNSRRFPVLVLENFGSRKEDTYSYKNWTRTLEGQQPVITSHGHILSIQFVPCANGSHDTHLISIYQDRVTLTVQNSICQAHHADFRALVSASDYTTLCAMNDEIALNQQQSNGLIYSAFSLGYSMSDPSSMYYSVYFQSNGTKLPMYITVYMDNFDIRCDSNSRFGITSDTVVDQWTTHCNLNRPFKRLSFPPAMMVRLHVHFNGIVANFSKDGGFKAYFGIGQFPSEVVLKTVLSDARYQGAMFYLQDNSTSNDTLVFKGKLFIGGVGYFVIAIYPSCFLTSLKACTETNCYTLFNGEERSLNRLSAEEMCSRETDGHLASIHSREELRYVRSNVEKWLQKKYRYLPMGPFMPVAKFLVDHVHLGAIKYSDTHGKKMTFWSDGSPVVFTSWSSRTVSIPAQSNCVVMELWQTVNDDVLAPGNCNETGIYFVCKSSTKAQANVPRLHMEIPASTVKSLNNKAHFLCGSGEILSLYAVCDGNTDCLDGSDERDCHHTDECNEKFKCGDGTCVPYSMYCDFVRDCANGMDEHFCAIDADDKIYFTCVDGRTVPAQSYCNGSYECFDKSDEIHCDGCYHNSGKSSFSCGDHGGCIPYSYVCNGVYDCVNHADENKEICNPEAHASCLEWWNNGTRTTGLYKLSDGIGTLSVECNFETTADTGLMQTLFHNIDLPPKETKGTRWQRLRYQGGGLVNRLIKGGKMGCEQTFTQTCLQNRLTVADLLNLHNHPEYWDCICIKYTTYTYKRGIALTPCSEATTKLVKNGVIALYSFTMLDVDTMVALWSSYTPVVDLVLRDQSFQSKWKPSIFVGPIRCENGILDFNNSRTLACVRGRPVSLATKCIYDYDDRGSIVGCADLTHLQNCGDSYATVCEDKSEHCRAWATVGECPKNPDYMLVNCKQSCKQCGISYKSNDTDAKICEDNSEHCSYWASVGECQNYPDYMLVTCKRSCMQCSISDGSSDVVCPDGYVRCPESFCIAVRYYCDGQLDCPTGDDEKYCNVSGDDKPHCKGHFRCMGTNVCLPQNQVCDGKIHCLHGDDERLCDFKCPDGCFCRGYEVECTHVDDTSALILGHRMSANTRKLHLSYGKVSHIPVLVLPYAGIFNSSDGKLVDLGSRSFSSMKRLLILDLRHNMIRKVKRYAFIGLNKLQQLLLDNNKLFAIESWAFQGLIAIKFIKISNTQLKQLHRNTFIGLENLTELHLTANDITTIDGYSFDSLSNLIALNIKFNKIETFDADMFSGLFNLQRLDGDDYAFCCLKPPNVTTANCTPYADEFSSCKDLMQSEAPRFLLWIVGVISLLGNILSLVFRLVFDRQRLKIGYGVFVTNLTLADFCMGIYLLIIAGADLYYRGIYIWSDKIWRHSVLCKFAGFLSTVSSEASVFFICLITFDRLLVIKFPFGSVKFSTRNAVGFSVVAWIFAAAIALVPFLFKSYFKEQFYSKNAVCLALPITRTKTIGWEYSVSVFIFINFLTFLLIALGQYLIYKEMNSSRKKTGSKKRQHDLVIARNLLLVVATDFLCWCPIGIMGIMSLCNVEVPGVVYVWTTVLILPINSALNPFLYTLSAIWRKEKFLPDVSEQSENSTIEISSVEASVKAHHIFGLNLERLKLLLGSQSVSLSELLRTEHGLSSDEARKVPEMLTKQLSYIHSMRMCFGDLTSEDIRVALDGKCVLHAGICTAPLLMKQAADKSSDFYNIGRLTNRLISMCNRTQVNTVETGEESEQDKR